MAPSHSVAGGGTAAATCGPGRGQKKIQQWHTLSEQLLEKWAQEDHTFLDGGQVVTFCDP